MPFGSMPTDVTKTPPPKAPVSTKKRHAPVASVPKAPVGYFLKTAVCILALLGSMVAFDFVCKDLADSYLLLIVPSWSATGMWFVWFGVTALLVAVTAGVMAVLVRPLWVAAIAMLLAGASFPLILGPDRTTIGSAVVFVLIMVLFLTYVSHQLKNQIHFSTHPLSDMKLLLLSLLFAFVSVAFGLGYAADAETRGFIIPPEIRAPLTETVIRLYGSTVESQASKQNLPPAQVAEVKKMARTQVQTMVDGAEAGLRQWKPYAAGVLGILLFLTLTTLLLFGFVPILIAWIVIWFLRATGFVRTETETIDVTHLTLN
jgi:hypothetical protein